MSLLDDTIKRLLSTRPPPPSAELAANVDEHQRTAAGEAVVEPSRIAPDTVERPSTPPAAPIVLTGVCGVCRERLADGQANAGRQPGCGHAIHMTCFARLVRSNRARCTLCPAPAIDSESAEQRGGYAVDVGHDADVHRSVTEALEYRRITVRDQLIVDAHARLGRLQSTMPRARRV